MKNTINLYLDSFKPKPDMPALQHIGLACLLVVGVLLAWHKLIVDQVTEAIERTSVLQQQLSSLEKERQHAEKRLAALPSGGALQQRLERLNETRQLKQDLLRLIQREVDSKESYAAILRGLSEQHDGRISLESISVNQGLLDLQGVAASSESLPAWLNGLSRARALKGKSFATLALEQKGEGLFFSVRATQGEPAQ